MLTRLIQITPGIEFIWMTESITIHCAVHTVLPKWAYRAQSRQSAKRFSSRWNWASPTPLAAVEYAPPPFGPGGGHTRLRLKGWGSPNSNEGTYTVVLYICKYFVISGYGMRTVYSGLRSWKKLFKLFICKRKKSVWFCQYRLPPIQKERVLK